MIKFDKLSSDEASSIAKKVVGTIILLAVTSAMASFSTWMNSDLRGLQEQEEQLNAVYEEKQRLTNSIADKTVTLSSIKLEDSGEIPSREELVVILGECAKESGVSIVGLDSNIADVDDSITKYNFVFELKGTTQQIAATLAGIDAHKLHYAIEEMSLRQNGDYLWLQRNFKEQITWWDLSNVTTAGGFQSRVNITADDIIGDDVMTLYLDLNFIFVNDNTDTSIEEESEVQAEG